MNKKGGRYQVFGGEYLYLLIGKKYNEKKSCVNTFQNFFKIFFKRYTLDRDK